MVFSLFVPHCIAEIGLNQTESARCGEGVRHTSMLDSSVLVAGVVIGVVLFLSCVAIILGSLRKNRCFRHLHLQRDDSYRKAALYGLSLFMASPKARSSEPPPSFYFSPSMETLSRVNLTHPDSPPRYDECVGDQAAQTCIPTDDPPPYSLIDPCRQNEQTLNVPWDEELSLGTSMERDAGYLSGPQDLQEPIPSISLSSSFPMEAAPPYETVVCEQNIPIPLVPLDVLKNSTNYYQNFVNRTM
uniref:Protein BEAN1 n=1 Tax=Varanus komodoensis TaxID=61221 RepID=A0A8D2Q5I3_VARKO